MSKKNEIVLFKNDDGEMITFEHLMKKIYNNHSTKDQHILATANDLKPMIKKLADAVTLMPTMIELQNASIRNDEQLIKLAAIVQRMESKRPKSDDNPTDFGFTQAMRDEMLEQAKAISQRPGTSAGDY